MASIIFMTDFSESYARGLLLGIAKYTHDIGEAWSICRLPLSIRDKYGIRAIVDYARKMKADVVIGQFNNDDDVRLFHEYGILAFAQDFKERFSCIPNITGEHYLAGCVGAEYLIKRGFRNFAFYGVQNVVWSEERMCGFRDTLAAANPEFSISELNLPEVNMWNYDFAKTAEWLQELPKPVALMACDDNHAYYVAETCRQVSINRKGEYLRIPEDIAILGVDNDETICMLSSPNLSSLGQDVVEGGYEVARMIDSILSGKMPPESASDIVVKLTNIITRHSTDILVNEDEHIAKVLKFIYERISQKICVDDIVKEVPLSRRLLENRFMSIMGTSIYDYIIRVRIDKIAEKLREGATVSDAAFELGFNDIKNLSRAFKRIKGVSPSEYRKSKKK